MAAYALLHQHDSKEPDGKYVATLLVDKTGKILAWGLNTNSGNRTLHAEVNMLQSWYRTNKSSAANGLPESCRIYTTLQCCAMCAGMIVATARKPDTIHVYYGMTDPSQKRATTALTRRNLDSLLSSSTDASVKAIKSAGATDLGTALDTDYRTAKMDAASYGRYLPFGNVTKSLKEKYERNTSGGALSKSKGGAKVVNPNVVKALEQVRMFLNHVGALHEVAPLVMPADNRTRSGPEVGYLVRWTERRDAELKTAV